MNVTETRSSLGVSGYYRQLICGFADISTGLPAARSTNTKCLSAWKMENEFSSFKEALKTLLVLVFPNSDKHFVVRTDASPVAVESVLS